MVTTVVTTHSVKVAEHRVTMGTLVPDREVVLAQMMKSGVVATRDNLAVRVGAGPLPLSLPDRIKVRMDGVSIATYRGPGDDDATVHNGQTIGGPTRKGPWD